MAVGMITVFIILMIVIQLSKCLILLVNKLAPEEAASHKRQAPLPPWTRRRWPSYKRQSSR